MTSPRASHHSVSRAPAHRSRSILFDERSSIEPRASVVVAFLDRGWPPT